MKTTVYWDRNSRPQGWAWWRGSADDPCAESGAVDLDHDATLEEAVAWACDEWDIEPAAWTMDESGERAEAEAGPWYEHCSYCGSEIMYPSRREAEAAPPTPDDDDGWKRIAQEHATWCEWTTSRGTMMRPWKRR